jgi:RNA polymerase sigma factor (TIGR02999 family)
VAADLTALLVAWRGGDQSALDRLTPLVYDELRRMARRHLRRERTGHTIAPTTLVHEAFLRLKDIRGIDWKDRAHFFAMAARVMRRVLIDQARARRSRKRAGGAIRVTFDDNQLLAGDVDERLIALNDALQALAEKDPRLSQVVELRYFGGLTVDETAAVLDVSADTVSRDWGIARRWLMRAVRRDREA